MIMRVRDEKYNKRIRNNEIVSIFEGMAEAWYDLSSLHFAWTSSLSFVLSLPVTVCNYSEASLSKEIT